MFIINHLQKERLIVIKLVAMNVKESLCKTWKKILEKKLEVYKTTV